MSVVKLNITLNGIDEAIASLEAFNNGMQSKCNELVNRLAEIGIKIANVYYSTAPYAGTNDVKVTLEPNGQGKVKIYASGNATLFIEFGTGITNPYDAPQARALLTDGGVSVAALGQFKHRRGNSKYGWLYPIENGLGSRIPSGTEESDKYPGLIHTYGSNATPAMYHARKKMIESIDEVVREVFGL